MLEPDELHKAVQFLLKTGEPDAEEWAIFDHEDFGASASLTSEWSGSTRRIRRVNALGAKVRHEHMR